MSDSDGEGAPGVDHSGLKKDFTYKLKAFKRRALHSITKVLLFQSSKTSPILAVVQTLVVQTLPGRCSIDTPAALSTSTSRGEAPHAFLWPKTCREQLGTADFCRGAPIGAWGLGPPSGARR